MREKKIKKQKSQELDVSKKRKIIQNTQVQIPVNDLTNSIIVTGKNNRMVKVIEVQSIPFSNMKNSMQNATRRSFENFLKNAPSSFQIKCLSVPADMSKQIKQIQQNTRTEENEECRRLQYEYIKSLGKAQEDNVSKKFYIAFSDENKALVNYSRQGEIEKAIARMNQSAQRIASTIKSCTDRTRILDNNEIAELMYQMLHRNTYRAISLEERYKEVYSRYQEASNGERIYIPPTEYLAPHQIRFENKNFYSIKAEPNSEEVFFTHLYIPSDYYPKAAVCGWLDGFINQYEGVDMDIFFRKINKDKYKQMLRRTMSHTSNDIRAAEVETTDSFANASSKYQNSKFMYRMIEEGQEIFNVSVMLTIFGTDLERIQETVNDLISVARSYDGGMLRDLVYQEEVAFKSYLPIDYLDPAIEAKSKRNMPQVTASTLYPFTSFQMVHDDGLYIGDSLVTGTPVVPNFWSKYFVQPHVLIVGTSGAGKTTFMELVLAHARAKGITCFTIAPQKEDDYKRLTLALGGQFIGLYPGSKDRINIMQIFENDKTVEKQNEAIYGELYNNKKSHLQNRIGVVSDFINTFYNKSKMELTIRERSILQDALIETYRRKGITSDNNSLWADEEQTKYKEMPILSDLLNVLEEAKEDVGNLLDVLRYITRPDGACAYFNGQTNIDVNNQFFTIGLEHNTDETKALSAYVAEDFCQIKIRASRRSQNIFAIDETWDMLNNSATAKKLEGDIRLLRGFNCSVMCGSQMLLEFLSTAEGQAIIKNCDSRILMKHKEEDIRYISSHIDLTENEKKMIQSFDVGQALFLAGNARLPIYANPTSFERLIIFNDSETVDNYVKYQEQKRIQQEKKRQEQEYIKQLDSIDDIVYDDINHYDSI